MKFIYTLLALIVGVMPCGAVAISFEQDDERGVVLSITGEGQPGDLFPQRLPRPWTFFSVTSPSGLWTFEAIGLAANLYIEQRMVHMSFLAELVRQGLEEFPFRPHAFDELLPLDGLLRVSESSWDSYPAELDGFGGLSFFEITSRPEALNPDSWTWAAGFTFRDTRPVPDAGSTLGMLALALGGLGFMRRKT